MKALFPTLALILSFFSTTSYANPQLLDAATETCNSYYKVAVVAAKMQADGMDEMEIIQQVIYSKMPESDKEIVVFIITSVYDGVKPVEIFDECYQAAFELYGSII